MEMPKPIIKLILTVFFGIIAFTSFGQYTPINTFDSKTLPDVHHIIINKSTFQVANLSKPILLFNSNQLPFFCKIEHKIEKTSPIALRFRLGDLNYVNMLENKNN